MYKDNKLIITATYKVKSSTTLLVFLLEKMNTSRNNVKHLLSNKQVLVNGNSVSQFNFPLAKEDEICITKFPVREPNIKIKKVKSNIKLDIIYEDEDFIAINKEAGLLSVASDKEVEETAYNLVANYLKNKGKRPYIIHRIDKETSGVLVFTTNIKIQSQLRLNWQKYVKEREYLAICQGILKDKEGTLINYLTKTSNNLMKVSTNKNDQQAITKYKVVAEKKDMSLLNISIKTGRKNQIRVQFANISHPLLGDDKYGDKNSFNRLALHASRLVFTHPFTNKILDIKAKNPSFFKTLFD